MAQNNVDIAGICLKRQQEIIEGCL